jgi:hypothetical protein
MEKKVAAMKAGAANAFIDPEGYRAFVASNERSYLTQLDRERKGLPPERR